MANGYLGDKAVQLPNMFPSPGQALASRINDINAANERQFELDYRHQKDKEADDWRKLNLIQELTDLSKYRTGSDVADAVGLNKMNEVYQRYTAAAGQMSPAELQARVQKEMAGIIGGMNATKEELNLADEQLTLMKQKFPSLDIGRLGKDYREEILHRRIGNNDFNNPLTVGQSTFDIQNPDVLAKYVIPNESGSLIKGIQNPQGTETVSVLKGNRNSYTPYTAKITPFKRENFDRGSLKEGFMTTSGEPKLEIKAKPIMFNGQSVMAMDEDVYKGYENDLDLISKTREKFSNYDNLSPNDKDIAKRSTLYDLVQKYDQSDYRPERPYTSPTTRNYINTGSGETKIRDVYGDIDAQITASKNDGKPYLQVNLLPGDTQSVVIDEARKATGNNQLGYGDIKLIKDDNGKIGIYNAYSNELIKYLTPTGTNIKAQPSVKEKREVIKQGNTQQKKDPLGIL